MKRPAVIVAVLSLACLAVVAQLYLPLPLLGSISRTYGVSAAGLVSSVFGVGYAFGFLLFGALSDRFGRRVVMVPGLVVLALASLLVASLTDFWGVLAGRAVQGLAAASVPSVALAYLQDRLPDHLKAFGIGCASTGALLSGPLGQLYGGALGTLSAAMVPLAAAYVPAAVLVALLPERRKDTGSGGSDAGVFSAYKGMGTLLRNGALVRAYAATLVMLFAFVGFYAGLERYGARTIEEAGLDMGVVRFAAAPAVLAALVAPWFMGRHGPARVAGAGFAVGSAGLLASALVAAFTGLGSIGAVWALVASSVVFVAGMSTALPSVIALVGSLEPGRRGTALSIYSFILFVGASLGPQLPPLIGLLAGTGVAGVAAVCAALAVLYAGASVIAAGARR